MGNGQYTLLGQLLLQYGMITEGVLAEALRRQEIVGEPLGQVLVSMDSLSARELELVLRAQARLRGKAGAPQVYVLVVDDDPEVGAVLGDILSGAGYSAGVAQNASEAIAALTADDNAEPALIVLDLGLPQIGGLALLSRLRGMGCETPVVVLTGSPDMEEEVRAAGLRISAFMVKPVPARTLVEAVDAAIESPVPV